MTHRFLLATLCLLLMSARYVSADSPTVVTSIKPLALIARQVVAPGESVSYLLPAGVSPHAYAMRVSDMRQIGSAGLFVWVGPSLETFLRKSLGAREPDGVLTLAELADIHWPEGGDSAHANERDHDHGVDPHLWLNPRNAAVIARALALRLGQINPGESDGYRRRAQAFAERVMALDEVLASQLRPVSDIGFAVYHDGYRHFVEHYGLRQLDYVSLTPEQRPGARHLAQVQKQLSREGACLFVEPYANTREAAALAERMGVRSAELDPLGTDKSIDSYSKLLQSLTESFLTCLLGQSR